MPGDPQDRRVGRGIRAWPARKCQLTQPHNEYQPLDDSTVYRGTQIIDRTKG